MNTDIKRYRGGQQGNQNARKHGYYCSAFSGVAKNNIIEAQKLTGLDDEIVMARASLKAIVQQSPTNARLISEATSTLLRLLRTSEKLGFTRPGWLDQSDCEVNIDDIVANL